MTDAPQQAPTDGAEQPIDKLTGTVQVDDLDGFVRHLVGWHQSKVKTVLHLAQVPEGATFTVGDGPEAKEIVLKGEALAGFKFGLEMALMQLGTLPFVAETEDTPAANDDAGG